MFNCILSSTDPFPNDTNHRHPGTAIIFTQQHSHQRLICKASNGIVYPGCSVDHHKTTSILHVLKAVHGFLGIHEFIKLIPYIPTENSSISLEVPEHVNISIKKIPPKKSSYTDTTLPIEVSCNIKHYI